MLQQKLSSFPFLLSSSLPNCWNSPVILSPSLTFLPSSLFGSLSFHRIPCLPYFVTPAHGEKKKKKDLFSCQSQRLGHHPPSLLTHPPIIVCLLHLFISPSNTSLLSSVPFSYFLTFFITSFLFLQRACLEIKRKACSDLAAEHHNILRFGISFHCKFHLRPWNVRLTSPSKTTQRFLPLKDFFYCILL